ncbi:TerD family protein [Flammeovirga aprica]|uniref:TerD family protein n=1 Tax=Flammeovirga aprica JL-4 TaxID=694437 RepID=A0A7X9S012_9BACT|nr:TerD family protein [Flammeovirga aprica]NME71840.1 TerD family protein [Flammeovirga aprica JL-4]
MGIDLKKGSKVNLMKDNVRLDKVMLGIGWDIIPGNSLDLDISVFMVGENGKLPADEYFIFYNNLKSPDNSVEHTGDNRDGEGDGDDEMILAYLSQINPSIKELIFVASIHNAEVLNHHFGMLDNAYIRIVDVDKKNEFLRFNLNKSTFGNATDMEFGRLIKSGRDWTFKATGDGTRIGLQGYVDQYV